MRIKDGYNDGYNEIINKRNNDGYNNKMKEIMMGNFNILRPIILFAILKLAVKI